MTTLIDIKNLWDSSIENIDWDKPTNKPWTRLEGKNLIVGTDNNKRICFSQASEHAPLTIIMTYDYLPILHQLIDEYDHKLHQHILSMFLEDRSSSSLKERVLSRFPSLWAKASADNKSAVVNIPGRATRLYVVELKPNLFHIVMGRTEWEIDRVGDENILFDTIEPYDDTLHQLVMSELKTTHDIPFSIQLALQSVFHGEVSTLDTDPSHYEAGGIEFKISEIDDSIVEATNAFGETEQLFATNKEEFIRGVHHLVWKWAKSADFAS